MKAVFVAALLLLSTFSVGQKDKSKRPSPPASTQCSFADGSKVSIDYSRPSMKGRKIYGELVPFDQEWRLGANEATTFVVDSNVKIGSTAIPKGSYTLFMQPSADKTWQLIISKKTGEWGIPYPGKESDFARVDLQKSSLDSPVELFTITLNKDGDACKLDIDWATTRASATINQSK
jgi:hypothetical protein